MLGAIAQERAIGFSVDVAAGLPSVDVDRERAVQVLSNLLANALKVTTKGGRVAIGAVGDADEVVFFVRDSGPGIDAAELPRLFERYWRSTKSTYKGAGLGLSIARGIVEAHSGRIWAESQVGVGSTFFFTLTPRA
jgi:signal transduction histidine kinase